MYSLNLRLTLSLVGSLMLFFVLQTALINRQVEKLGDQTLVSRLEHDQKALLAAVNWQDKNEVTLNVHRIPDIYTRVFSGHYYEITVAGKRLLSRSLWDEQLAATTTPFARNVMGPQGQTLLVLSQDFTIHGVPIKVRVAEDVSHLDAMTKDFQDSLLLLAAVAVLILLVLQGGIIRYGLKPLQRIRQQLGQLERGEIRQITTPAPKEIGPLVEEINNLVTLLNKRLDRSRYALGNLAHALKTPLSVMQQIVERQSDTPDSKLLQKQLQHIEQRISYELGRARTAGRSPGRLWATPYDDLQDLLSTLKKLFPDKKITLNMSPSVKIEADREDMLEVFGNLLENACKWAKVAVCCRVNIHHDKLLIVIDDDGAGMDPDKYQHLLNRGAREDENKPGYGLGLSIVDEIVRAYEGDMAFEPSSRLQGLCVRIVLPQHSNRSDANG